MSTEELNLEKQIAELNKKIALLYGEEDYVLSDSDKEGMRLNQELANLNTKIATAFLGEDKTSDNPASEKQTKLIQLRREVSEEISFINDEIAKRRSREDPGFWIDNRLGEFLWTKQEEIMSSISDFRKTAVPSCFGSGKSHVAARIAAWWIDIHPPGSAFVVSTASRGAQVKAILWKQINRVHNKGKLPGRVNQTEWWLKVNGIEEMVGFGRKPNDLDATAFQGIHARYVLVILDEAAGISEALWEAAESLIVNEDSRMLAIGNPEDCTSPFADVCKPGSGWNVIQIPAFITPNFTDESVPEEIKAELISKVWVEEKRKKWGEDNPYWVAKVLAEFPSTQIDGLIPVSWIRAAQERELPATGVKELGVDVGAGGDKSVISLRIGGRVRVIHKSHNPDTMETCGEVIAKLSETGASIAKVDEIGIGKGIVDRAKEQKKPVIGINVSKRPIDEEHFVNLRAESYWRLRELFESGQIDIDSKDEDLAAQLVELKYRRTSAGKIQVESKQEMINRLGHSPDECDSVMLAFAEDVPEPSKRKGAVWGRHL